MRTIVRGSLLGAAFGVATTCFEISFAVYRMTSMRMPPLPFVTAQACFLEVLLGAVLGVLVAPLLALGRGVALHVVTVCAAWLALERIVAPDPQAINMWAMAPVVGLVLTAVGLAVSRRWPRIPWALGVAALAGTVVVPIVIYDRQAVESEMTLAPPPVGDAPDIVLIVLDTVRAQSVSAYGYERRTTPTFDQLASEGALFLDATAPSTWSLPSHASLFTGWFPSGHGAHGEHRVLRSDLPTIAEALAEFGYDTLCFTANPHISDAFGLTRGFRWSDRAYLAGLGGRSFIFIFRVLDFIGISVEDKGGAFVAANFEDWVASRQDDGRPAFVFLNFLEAHFPYHQVPPAFLAKFTERSPRELREVSLEVFGAQFGRHMTASEIDAVREPARAMYDAGVLYSDHLLGRVTDALHAAGRLDNTILVVLSDHGEMLGEHDDFGHGSALYEPGIRVPLFLRYPAAIRAGVRVNEPVSTAGVFATIFELAGLELPGRVQVGSLLPALDGEPAGAPVVAERFAHPEAPAGGPVLIRRDVRYRVYRSESLKLVQGSEGSVLLFDLATDPDEGNDIARTRTADLERVEAELDAWAKAIGLPALDAPVGGEAAPELDAATRERLEALGYVD